MRNECTLTGTVADKIHPFEDAGTHEHLTQLSKDSPASKR